MGALHRSSNGLAAELSLVCINCGSGKQPTNRTSEEINITAEEILRAPKEAARGRNNTGSGGEPGPSTNQGRVLCVAHHFAIEICSQLQSVTATWLVAVCPEWSGRGLSHNLIPFLSHKQGRPVDGADYIYLCVCKVLD